MIRGKIAAVSHGDIPKRAFCQRMAAVESEMTHPLENQKVLLWNGSREDMATAEMIYDSLRRLDDSGGEGATLFLHLKDKCKNPSYEIPAYSAQKLQAQGLLNDNGSVPTSVSNVLLSMLNPPLELSLRSPFAE